MPEIPSSLPLVDGGNPLISSVPAMLTTGLHDTPIGQRLIVTIRTTSATVSVLLDHDDAKSWSEQLAREVASMSSAGLTVARQGQLPAGLEQYRGS